MDPSKLDGQLSKAIQSTLDSLYVEIDKSIKFFEGRHSGKKLEKIIITGGASLIPNFAASLAQRLNINVEIGNAWYNVTFPASQQAELMAVANQFGVAVGLAGRTE